MGKLKARLNAALRRRSRTRMLHQVTLAASNVCILGFIPAMQYGVAVNGVPMAPSTKCAQLCYAICHRDREHFLTKRSCACMETRRGSQRWLPSVSGTGLYGWHTCICQAPTSFLANASTRGMLLQADTSKAGARAAARSMPLSSALGTSSGSSLHPLASMMTGACLCSSTSTPQQRLMLCSGPPCSDNMR